MYFVPIRHRCRRHRVRRRQVKHRRELVNHNNISIFVFDDFVKERKKQQLQYTVETHRFNNNIAVAITSRTVSAGSASVVENEKNISKLKYFFNNSSEFRAAAVRKYQIGRPVFYNPCRARAHSSDKI